jgi:hypothetical protein
MSYEIQHHAKPNFDLNIILHSMSTTTAEPNIKNQYEFFVSRWLVTAILSWKWNEQPEFKLLSTQHLCMFTSLATEGNRVYLNSYQEQTLILVSHNTI